MITLYNVISGTTIKIRSMQLSSITIYYLIFLETLSQGIVLRIVSKFYMFLEMARRGRNIDISCITWNYTFSGTISIRMKIPKSGQFNRWLGLYNLQAIHFALKKLTAILAVSEISRFLKKSPLVQKHY